MPTRVHAYPERIRGARTVGPGAPKGTFGRRFGLAREQRDQDDDRDRHADQPEQNGAAHDVFPFRCCCRMALRTAAIFPGAVAQAATFGGRQTGRERAGQQRGRQPQ
jgi:hypothetical protein